MLIECIITATDTP